MVSVLKRALWLFLAFLLIATIGFLSWATWIPQPEQVALDALQSDDLVSFRSEPTLAFVPVHQGRRIGLIIYPGARVDPRAYAPLARSLAAQGITVLIPSMPLNLAVFSPNAANDVISDNPDIESWFVAGHSLGGTMAADFAARNRGSVNGLILLASYPLESSNLAESDLPVISIYGSNDLIATVEEVTAARNVLPSTTEWAEIDGGNHAQFGWYGMQNGDGTATISGHEQQKRVEGAILRFIYANAR